MKSEGSYQWEFSVVLAENPLALGPGRHPIIFSIFHIVVTVEGSRDENARIKNLAVEPSFEKDMLQSVIRNNSLGS